MITHCKHVPCIPLRVTCILLIESPFNTSYRGRALLLMEAQSGGEGSYKLHNPKLPEACSSFVILVLAAITAQLMGECDLTSVEE